MIRHIDPGHVLRIHIHLRSHRNAMLTPLAPPPHLEIRRMAPPQKAEREKTVPPPADTPRASAEASDPDTNTAHPRLSHSALKYRNQVPACSFGTSKRMGQSPCSKRRSCSFANPPLPSAVMTVAFDLALGI